MRQAMRVLCLIVFAGLMTACTTEVVNPGADLPAAAEANARLGLGYMNQGDYELAMGKLKKALRFDEENANAHHYLGELNRILGENKAADEHFKKALQLKPGDSSLINNYGVFLCDTEQYAEAKGYFNRVLNDPLYRDKPRIYENLALCAQRKGNLSEAELSYRKALRLEPRLPKSLLAMAQLSFDQRQALNAYAFYQRYIEINAQSSQSLWLGVLLERDRGNHDKAASYSLLLKGKYPNSKETALLRKLEARGG